MKNLKTLSTLALALMLTGPAFSANVGSPQNVKMKIHELWVSPNTDCTGMTRIYNDAAASYQDVTLGPTFGTLDVANGVYQCIAWKMSDVVKLTPDYTSDSGNCIQGVEVTRDLFRPGDVAVSPTGDVINGNGAVSAPVEDGMWVYLSTTGNDTTNSATQPTEPGVLSAPYVVSGDNNATMVFDFSNGIEDTGGSCSPETVVFSFRYR